MNLIFSYVHPSKAARSLGPFRSVRLSFDGMRDNDHAKLLAAYHKHQCAVDGERSSPYGPYERFSAVNGLAYGDDRVITFLDLKKNEWLYYDSGHHWPDLVVSEIKAAN
jgi:hypothetical protein